MREGLFYFGCLIFFFHCQNKSENKNTVFFQEISGEELGITFANNIAESEKFNIIDYLYYYNGGGMAVGDINNDSLPDIYFASNEGLDKLFINNGNLNFTDVTYSSGLKIDSTWSTGVSMADINNDGFLDIYVCKLGNYKGKKANNLLYINRGDGTFKEMAEGYGLNFSGFSTQAAFFDYDKDGDLDCYLLNHSVKSTSQFRDSKIRFESSPLSGDRLYENQKGHFKDITEKAGIYSSEVGFGLGLKIVDLNDDNWPDIYVGNDFHENDYVYLNQKDGTFKEVSAAVLGHMSQFTMGVDIADLNNDCKPDIFSLDMRPNKEKEFKSSGEWESIEIFNFKQKYGYLPQLPRNNLQYNSGFRDSLPFFQELACMQKVAATDWSWSTKIADFDLNGHKDIAVANGILRRPNDLDFIAFISNQIIQEKASDSLFMTKMPKGLASNVVFFQSDSGFIEQAISNPGISNALAVGDLDMDGDMDIITNNTNDFPSVYRNKAVENGASYIAFQDYSLDCIGCKLTVFQGKLSFYEELQPVNGFQSCSEPKIIFPVLQDVDSMTLETQNGKHYVMHKPDLNKTYSISDFRLVTEVKAQPYTNQTFDTIHTLFSSYNKNLQQEQPLLLFNPKFYKPFIKNLPLFPANKRILNTGLGGGLLILNLENNQYETVDNLKEFGAFDLDIQVDTTDDKVFILRAYPGQKKQPVVLIGKIEASIFELEDKVQLPFGNHYTQLQLIDEAQDGDMDIMVIASFHENGYGLVPDTYILTNDKGTYRISDPMALGMVQNAFKVGNSVFVVGHWMPIKWIHFNQEGIQVDSLEASSGLWNTVWANFEKDSVLLAGNCGVNHLIPYSNQYPFRLFVKDLDNNGTIEQLFSYYKEGKWYPYHPQKAIIKQLPHKKKDFLRNSQYAKLSFNEIFSEAELAGSQKFEVEKMESGYFKKKEGKWSFYPFPPFLQQGPIGVIQQADSNYLAAGNFYEFDPSVGIQDAQTPSVFHFSKEAIARNETFLLRDEICGSTFYADKWFLLSCDGRIFYQN